MKDNFAKCLALVLKSEGGYVNSKLDPGGATNKGITQRVYDEWRHAQNLPLRPVKEISDQAVAAIYRANYWNAVKGDTLPLGLDYAVFDYAVNSGPVRALKSLAAHPSIDGICDERLAFLKGLKTWATFGRGWANRVAAVRSAAKSMTILPKQPASASAGPKTPLKLLGDTPMASTTTVTNTLNTLSLSTAFTIVGASIPLLLSTFGTYGLIAAGVLFVCILVQSFLPVGTAKAIEDAAVSLIPMAEGFDPALKPVLEQVLKGIQAAQAEAPQSAVAVAAAAPAVAPVAVVPAV